MYKCCIRPLLFCLMPESAHHVTLMSLKLFHDLRLAKFYKKDLCKPKIIMGIEFKNAIGLAAGLDKNGDYIDALSDLGFGFLEIGTITPKAQSGNPLPRLFRIPEAQAIINRMGFNNKGIDHLINNVKAMRYKGVLGINIGKNAVTPIEEAVNDYLICLRKAYEFASYITINISSPNTSGLRNLQHGQFLQELLSALKEEQRLLAIHYNKYVPLVVKVAPDLTEAQVVELADAFLRFNIDGVITTNTTLDHSQVAQFKQGAEQGGLSGMPVREKSTHILKLFYRELQGKISLIAAGGIVSGDIAREKIDAGAALVQLYTGLIYQGPNLIKECFQKII